MNMLLYNLKVNEINYLPFHLFLNHDQEMLLSSYNEKKSYNRLG